MKNKNEQAPYDITITGPVRQDERLSRDMQYLYGLLRGLAVKTGYCYASNRYLAKEMKDVSNRTIQRWIKVLEECGHIYISRTDQNKNARDIYMTDSKHCPKQGMTQVSYPTTAASRGMTPVSREGMTPVSPRAAGIRKNTLNTTTTPAAKGGNPKLETRNPKQIQNSKNEKTGGGDGGFDLSKIPKKITSRFGIKQTLAAFARNCGGDSSLMQRYIDYSEKAKAKNPVGLAVRMAEEHKRDGPPDAGKLKPAAVRYQPAGRDERKHLTATT